MPSIALKRKMKTTITAVALNPIAWMMLFGLNIVNGLEGFQYNSGL